MINNIVSFGNAFKKNNLSRERWKLNNNLQILAMQESFFLNCTETTRQTLTAQMFDDAKYFNNDLQYDSAGFNDLSLKLRGNIFEQYLEPMRDENCFNLTSGNNIGEFLYSDIEKSQQPIKVSETVFGYDGAEGEIRSTKSHPRSHNSSNSLQCFDKDELQSIELMNIKEGSSSKKIKFDSTKSDTTSCKVEEDEQRDFNSPSVYKTPNYKSVKKSTQKYMTKYSTPDLKLHEEKMKEKYGINLSIRKDVVNKTLFRSLKRFHTENFFGRFSLAKKEKPNDYLEKVRIYCSDMELKETVMKNFDVTIEEIVKFVAIMVSPNHIKNSLNDESDANLYKDYYSCLYQYSHKKLANMLQNRVCSFLFSVFINDGHLANFIINCSTMSQHPDIYHKASKNFLSNLFISEKREVDKISFN